MRDLEQDWAASGAGGGCHRGRRACVALAGERPREPLASARAAIPRRRAPRRGARRRRRPCAVRRGTWPPSGWPPGSTTPSTRAGRGDDEQRSADLAEQVLTELGVPAQRVGEVRRLVLLTAAHDPAAGDDDGAVLCDADLAILASEPQRYGRYVRGGARRVLARPGGAVPAPAAQPCSALSTRRRSCTGRRRRASAGRPRPARTSPPSSRALGC